MDKKYQLPVFEVIIQDESNKVFFSASGETTVSGVLASIGINVGEWE